MKTKLKFLTFQSLKKKVSTKWFKVANILILVLLIGVVNIDRIISFFGGDFKNVTKVYIVDGAGAYDLFKTNFDTLSSSLEDLGNYELEKSNQSLEKLKEEVKEKENIVVLNIKISDTEYLQADIISYEPLDMVSEQLFQMSLNNVKSTYVLQMSGMSSEEIAALTSNVSINKQIMNDDYDGNEEGHDIVSSGLIVVFIVPFFILITMLTQMIGAEINDEKSTRSMEIIISNVSPKVHFASKIISSTLFVFTQGLCLLGDICIAFLVRKLLSTGMGSVSGDVANAINDFFDMIKKTGILNLLWQGLPFIIILFILSFLAYAIMAGVLASMTTNTEDYQQLQTPLMILLMVGYYIAIMASAFEGAVFVKIVAYIPMISFLVAPVIFLLGQISLLELAISTIICGVFVYVIFHFGLRIYKVGILNYSSQDLWKKIFKSIKEK